MLVFQGAQLAEEAVPSISNTLKEQLGIFRFPHCSLSAQSMHLQLFPLWNLKIIYKKRRAMVQFCGVKAFF